MATKKSIPELDRLQTAVSSDLLLVSHLSGQSYVTRAVPLSGLQPMFALSADVANAIGDIETILNNI